MLGEIAEPEEQPTHNATMKEVNEKLSPFKKTPWYGTVNSNPQRLDITRIDKLEETTKQLEATQVLTAKYFDQWKNGVEHLMNSHTEQISLLQHILLDSRNTQHKNKRSINETLDEHTKQIAILESKVYDGSNSYETRIKELLYEVQQQRNTMTALQLQIDGLRCRFQSTSNDDLIDEVLE